ncbi:phosphonopyruvate decarboxylase [Desulfuribacillus alkaliarsenatis]|uniref:Phosphonopyruvate decarboxylase n=1 Tax=Desulfuribacillus alkaliarsenatis TaxID=766136 RepID=A0A1E5G4W8_9FIRM|nr:phosphonopyruvate decarboxylase [Desulfuribacillus alkaliarsenatis]OEF97724.1 phosphonopyruvate decarboxylase [Desulfuribacillus alkaliarsenatis]
MLSTKNFVQQLKCIGFTFFSGVPCSFFKDFINYAINECEYIMAANEGDAVATCAGAYLGGRKSVFLCQNSGLTNALSPLTSLNHTFEIPVLGFVSLRGEVGIPDEPQHELLGQVTGDMLNTARIAWEYLSDDWDEALKQIKRANEFIRTNKSFFFIVKKGTFDSVPLNEQSLNITRNKTIRKRETDDQQPKRLEALDIINRLKDNNTGIFTTTGMTGRELFEIEDAPNNLYMVGSMGCVSALALGAALVQQDKKFIAIDGDAAFLMRMGSIATNAYYNPPNLFHLLLDNHAHESTGCQQTVSQNIDFVSIAASVGYDKALYIHNLNELSEAISEWNEKQKLTFAYMKISTGTKKDLGRPKVSPPQVKERFVNFLRGETHGE